MTSLCGQGRNHQLSLGRTVPCAAQGFHHARLASQAVTERLPRINTQIRPALDSNELGLAARLRAESFYEYPPERAFAGQRYQDMKASEEWADLRDRQRRAETGQLQDVCLLAVQEGPEMKAIGTLDLVVQSTLPKEVLRGSSQKPAYLANFCVAKDARRQGVGTAMIQTAKQLAAVWEVDALFVHMMAANTSARTFYESHKFRLDKEESSNMAHYRGRCLDGISGGARTILLRYDI